MKKIIFTQLILTLIFCISFGQEVYVHISDKNIYDFLDEMASMKIIEVNTAIKPYSRIYIAEKLKEVSDKTDKLNKREKKELQFYLKDYNLEIKKLPDYFNPRTNLIKNKSGFATSLNPAGIFYKDTLFTFSFRLIGGIQYYSNDNGAVQHRWNGVEAFAYVGKHLSLYANIRDNRMDENFADPKYLTDFPGRDFKVGGDFSEMRGGLVYSWKWGSLGLLKDHIEWGNNYHGSNILSGRTPSFALLKLNLHPVKWLDFNYFHGWLVSDVYDSFKSYNFDGGTRVVYYNKYIAANMYSIRLMKNLNVSIGNSVVYSSDHLNPYFLIPLLFFKSLDHTLYESSNAGQNSQIFFDISSRQIKYVHMYASVFIDELSFKNFRDTANQSNWFGGKFGIHFSNIFKSNLSMTAEVTATNPMVYKHYIPTTTFESSKYNLGYYLRDNSFELYLDLSYKPIRGLMIDLSYTDAKKGPDYDDRRGPTDRVGGFKYMEKVIWESNTLAFKINYEVINNGYVFVEYSKSDITTADYINIRNGKVVTANEVMSTYTPEFFWGSTNTISVGMNLGF